ncbi:MAG: hypothetical protein ABWY57_15845 [Mycetocola sp.]
MTGVVRFPGAPQPVIPAKVDDWVNVTEIGEDREKSLDGWVAAISDTTITIASSPDYADPEAEAWFSTHLLDHAIVSVIS